MGFLGALFGGGQGAGFQAQGVTPENLLSAMQQTGTGVAQQQNFVNSLQGLGGQSIAAQQGLLGQLQQGAAGQGPNPALAQLANTTGQNVSQQAALMGSQRGVGSNPGLLARQAAQQGSQIQQNAAGQAAALAAQQHMAYQ